MPFLITNSPSPLQMDTIPALKLTHFNGAPRRDTIYAYARMYVCNGDVRLSMTCFDETPPETQRMGVALCPAGNTRAYLFFSLNKAGDTRLCLMEQTDAADRVAEVFTPPAARIFSGNDEQGWYWSAESSIPAAAFDAAFGCVPDTGGVLAGNVFLYDSTEAAFGAAFGVPLGAQAPTAQGFEPFTIVPY